MTTRLPRRGGIGSRAAIGLLAAIAAFLVAAAPSPALAEDGGEPVVLTLFYGEGCPHCAAEKAFLVGLQSRHPDLVIEQYEVWYSTDNLARFERMAAAHGIDVSGVPTTFLAGSSWVGYSDAIGSEIEAVVAAELAAAGPAEPSASPEPAPTATPGGTVTVPILGEIDAAATSLVTVTAAIALVDGFNPCSLWVLSILLAMMLHSGSRRRLLAVGVTFLVVAGAAYGLFMLGLFAVLDWVGYTDWVRFAIAGVVGLFGLVAIKDYFWFGRGLSFSIPEERKPEITRRSRALALSERSLLLLVPMTALLAAGVSLLELPCTAGFPVLWNGILAERGVAGVEFAALLGLYLTIYLVDELVLFAVAFTTLRVTRMQERHGRALKLIAGTVMVSLASVMLVSPGLLDTVGGALAVFGTALVVAAIVLAVAPRLGLVRETDVVTDESHVGRGRRQRMRRTVH